jgi:hypothetical protein
LRIEFLDLVAFGKKEEKMYIGKRPEKVIILQAVTCLYALIMLPAGIVIAPFTGGGFFNFLVFYGMATIATVLIGLPAVVASINPFADKKAIWCAKVGSWIIFLITVSATVLANYTNFLVEVAVFFLGLSVLLWIFLAMIIEKDPEVKEYLSNQ